MLIDPLELRPGTAATETEVRANKSFAVERVQRRKEIARQGNNQYYQRKRTIEPVLETNSRRCRRRENEPGQKRRFDRRLPTQGMNLPAEYVCNGHKSGPGVTLIGTFARAGRPTNPACGRRADTR